MIKKQIAEKKLEGKDWTVEDLIDADYKGFKTNYKSWNSRFNNPFQALDFCFRNPNKEIYIESDRLGRGLVSYDKKCNIFLFDNYPSRESPFRERFTEKYWNDLINWKNIREHSPETKEKE